MRQVSAGKTSQGSEVFMMGRKDLVTGGELSSTVENTVGSLKLVLGGVAFLLFFFLLQLILVQYKLI